VRHPPESLKRDNRQAFVDRMNSARRVMESADEDFRYVPREPMRLAWEAAVEKHKQRQRELAEYDAAKSLEGT